MAQGDGIIDFSEFKDALDVFAEMEVGGDDIDFQIEREESGMDEKGSKSFTFKIVKTASAAKSALKSKWFL